MPSTGPESLGLANIYSVQCEVLPGGFVILDFNAIDLALSGNYLIHGITQTKMSFQGHNYSPLCDIAVFNSAIPFIFFAKLTMAKFMGAILQKLRAIKSK